MNFERFRSPAPPVYRASTVLFDDTAHLARVQREMAASGDASLYGAFGTPTTAALATEVLSREGGFRVAFTPSGLSAVALSLLSVLRAGDHLLMTDSCYGPTRELCRGVLARLGITTDFFDPTIGSGIASLIRSETRAVFLESPGSFTFEVVDVSAIVAALRHADHERASDAPIYVLLDNAWGSPGLFAPFEHGVDVSIIPLTKYWGGHADLLLGAVVSGERAWKLVRGAAHDLGLCTNGEDAALALRGARTVDVRLRAHAASALEIARWLALRSDVGRVLHPAFPDSPGHELWKRDFKGSNGLLSFELLMPNGDLASVERAAQLADLLTRDGVFGLGYSWGGFESLVMPGVLPTLSHMARSARPWTGGALIRLHVGLEPVELLLGSLERALNAIATG
ncbi:MAG: cystathionine beta-lyase [Gemmatimonadaceae bacterium]